MQRMDAYHLTNKAHLCTVGEDEGRQTSIEVAPGTLRGKDRIYWQCCTARFSVYLKKRPIVLFLMLTSV